MSENMEILARGARELGLELSRHQLDQFQVYYRELADWNQRMNLTAVTEYEEVQVKHFLDSLTLCLARPGGPGPGQRVIDLGTGGGFPGLPLKLAFPQLVLDLVDSVGKKTAFVRHLIDLLSLPEVTVHTGRAETLAHRAELRGSFDLALARGLAKLPALLEYTLPFCRPGGQVVAWKHGGIDAELDSAATALGKLGGRLAGIYPVTVTGLTDNRILVVVEQTGPTPAEYPRRPGVPSRQPL